MTCSPARRRTARSCAWLGFVFAGAASALGQGTTEQIQQALDVSKFTLQSIDVPAWAGGEVQVFCDLGSGPTVLALTPHSLRGDTFKMLVDDGRTIEVVEAPAPRTFKGEAFELAGGSSLVGSVRASLLDDGLWAQVRMEDGRRYGIEPLSSALPGAEHGMHVIYEKSDLVAGDWSCGTDLIDMEVRGPATVDPAGKNQVKTTVYRVVEIGVDSDYEFFTKNASNPTTAAYDMENVLNGVEGIYEAEVQITFELTVVIVRTSASDPYTLTNPTGSGSTLLTEFRSYWQNNYSGIKRDVAHFMSGKNWTSGGVIGVAYLNGVCGGNAAYGAVETKYTGSMTYRQSLSAHELGHNWDASHCNAQSDCGIMCSGIGGCSGQLTKFGVSETNQITAWKNSHVNCLPLLEDSVALPFNETFPSGTISAVNWSHVDGGTSITSATNEPSAPNSLNLDSAGPGASDFDDDDDEVRSNFILAAGAGAISLGYKVERTGVESGEQLIVEYRTSALTWANLNTLTSDGIDQSTFTSYSHVLPANAKHNELRIRFRVNGNETNDDWYIDDVTVGVAAPAAPTISSVGPNPSIVLNTSVITITGTGFTGATQVAIGADLLSPGAFSVASDASIQVINYIPSSLGAKSVVVTTPNGTSNSSNVTLAKCDPPLLIVPAITNNGGMFTMSVAGEPNWAAFYVMNLTNSTFSFAGQTWLSSLLFVPFGNLNAVGYQNLSVPVSGLPSGTTFYSQYWTFPPGATSATQAEVSNIGSTLTLF